MSDMVNVEKNSKYRRCHKQNVLPRLDGEILISCSEILVILTVR